MLWNFELFLWENFLIFFVVFNVNDIDNKFGFFGFFFVLGFEVFFSGIVEELIYSL